MKARDSDGLASALVTLYQNRELAATMGQAGRQTVKANFSLHLMAEQMSKLYKDLSGHK